MFLTRLNTQHQPSSKLLVTPDFTCHCIHLLFWPFSLQDSPFARWDSTYEMSYRVNSQQVLQGHRQRWFYNLYYTQGFQLPFRSEQRSVTPFFTQRTYFVGQTYRDTGQCQYPCFAGNAGKKAILSTNQTVNVWHSVRSAASFHLKYMSRGNQSRRQKFCIKDNE